MPKQSKNAKNKKATEKSQPNSEEVESSKPKASKFFVPEDNDSDEKPVQKPTQSKFFAAVEDDDDAESEEKASENPKDKPKPQSKFFGGDDESDADDKPEKNPKEEAQKPKSKFFGGDDDEDEEKPDEKPSKQPKDEQKPKSKFFGGDDDEDEEKPSIQPKEEQKPKSKFFGGDDDEDDKPDEKPEPEPKNVQEKEDPKKGKSNKGKKKGKKGKKDTKEEDDDDLPEPPKQEAKPQSKFFTAEAEEEPNEEPEKGVEEKPKEELTAEEKVELEKKEKKKEKRKAKKEAQKDKKDDKKEEKKEEKKDDKKPKKMTAAAKIAYEKMQKLKEEEERLRREEEERQRIEEEERKRAEEEERLRREAEERKKKEKEDKIAQMKKEGTYMTKTQRKKMEEDLLKRKQLEEMGLLQQIEKDNVVEEKKPEVKKKFFKKKDPLQEYEEKLRRQELEKQQQQGGTSSTDPQNQPLPQNPGSLTDVLQEPKPEEKVEPTMVEDWSQLAQEKTEQPAQEEEKVERKEDNSEKKGKKDKDEKKKSSKNAKKEKTKVEEETKADQIQSLPTPNNEEGQTKEKSLIELRSPICCILGHVDTGKTTILDRIRNTNVQEGEAGGITQQIGATFFPSSKLQTEIDKLKGFYDIDVSVPGLLIIDTPGHESFSNLRSRGSSLCDIAILVIDLMHGIEKQTMESLELLKMRKTPFIVAVNKIDRCYEWKAFKNESSYLSLKKQQRPPFNEFKRRLDGIITELAEKGFNASLYWENPDVGSYVSLVPTSGITGEGLPDLLGVILKYSSKFLKQKIKMLGDYFDCTVLEVKMIEGLGTTIDVILVNGEIREGDTVVLMGFNGPIVTTIRALLTPHPMKEMRVKNEYVHHKVIQASMGVKISANDLENAVAGSHLYVAHDEEEIASFKRELAADFEGVRKKIELVNQGVCVAASTLGSLEALLQFLKTSKIPVAHIGVGPVSKEDVTKSLKAILADDEKRKKKEFATVLAFDVKILPEAQLFADQNGIKIFTANIIYHLFDQFMAYVNEVREERKREEGKDAVFPCILKTVAFINKKDPLILGVDVVKGILRIGTPLCLYDQSKLKIGVVENIELNKKPLKEAVPSTGSVAIRLKSDANIMAGRHFELTSRYVSILSRNSIDLLKEYFRDEMGKAEWDLIRDLKPYFQIF